MLVKLLFMVLTSNKTYTVNLTKPTGVREISEKTITIELVLDDVNTKEIKSKQIKTINLASGYSAQALSAEHSSVDIIVKGSSSVLDALDESTITAYIDLTGLKEGEHEVEVKVTGEDTRLTYASRVKKVKIKITKN